MPIYPMKNKETGEITEFSMSYKEYDQFKEDHPELERYFCVEDMHVMSDGLRLSTPGTGVPDSTFEKYIIGRMAETIPGNTIKQNHKTSRPREW